MPCFQEFTIHKKPRQKRCSTQLQKYFLDVQLCSTRLANLCRTGPVFFLGEGRGRGGKEGGTSKLYWINGFVVLFSHMFLVTIHSTRKISH